MKLYLKYHFTDIVPDELNYLVNIVSQVADFFFHDNINFYITNDINVNLNTENNIIFLSGCEKNSELKDQNFKLCFNNFYRNYNDKRYVPFPLGNNKFINDNLYSHEIIPFEKREYDIFFAGFIHPSRSSFKEKIEKLNCKKYLHYTHRNNLQNFNENLNPEEYLNILNNSKIVLAPKGAFHATSYRYFESLYFQNIVIFQKDKNEEILSSDKFANQYCIQDWNELSDDFIKKIILNFDEEASKNNYKNYFCKQAIITSTIDKINQYVK